MIYRGKIVQVVLRDEAKLQWDDLQIPSLTSLFNAIQQKLEILKADPEHGTHIPNDRVPKEYILKYEVNNLWKVNLPKAWRMIYTLRGNSYEITVFIIDILSHKEYEKKFGYKT